jgi:dsRNA-specific ribonuclease
LILEKRLKYVFKNKFLLLEAVTHPTVGRLEITLLNTGSNSPNHVVQKVPGTRKEIWKGDYERLEYLGDAIIEYLTLAYAFVTYEEWLPGSLSQWKSATVSNDALGKTAIACFGIDECICIGNVRIDQQTIKLLECIERKYPCSSKNNLLSLRILLVLVILVL